MSDAVLTTQIESREGVQVIGLALDTPDGVRDFIARVPVRYPILLDAPGPADASVWLGNAKGVLPYTVLVDADGRIARQKVGPFQIIEAGKRRPILDKLLATG